MKRRVEIPPHTLAEILRYDPETGHLYWKQRPIDLFAVNRSSSQIGNANSWNTKYANTRAFKQLHHKGYHYGHIFDQLYFAHRVIWALVHGEWPEQIDHINGDRADNRIENLRSVNNTENSKNRVLSKRNKSGVIGVRWKEKDKLWIAQIGFGGVTTYVGCAKNKSAAIAMRKAAELNLGYHPNHGRSQP